MVRKRRPQVKVHESANWQQTMLVGAQVADERDMSSNSQRMRLIIISAAIFVLISVLFVRLLGLQVFSESQYVDLAEGNRVREIISYAPRGKILDRNGIVLASNTLSFELSLAPYLLEDDPLELNRDIAIIATILKAEPSTVRKAVLKESLGYLQPVIVANSLSHIQALRFEQKLPELRGFQIDEVPIRSYDSSAALGHIIGYTSRVNEEELQTREDVHITDFIGRTGVEQSFDERLRGKNGFTRIEVDALGQPVRVLEKSEPQPGNDLVLTIDFKLQTTMAQSIAEQMQRANSRRASGVAVDPVSGEVLAIVNLPSYDNNLFTNGISQKDFSKLVNDPLQPLYNDAVGGGFTTGSIIKPLVASAALQEGVVNENTVIVDTNALTIGEFSFASWRPGGLGPMNIRRAIAWSSNIFFYTVGGGYGNIVGLGEERLTNYYRQFGLGERSGIKLPNETAGRVPDEQWKIETKGENWYVGDSYNISIGQGDMLVSPLQITMAEAAIANGGDVLTPLLEKGAQRQVRRRLKIDQSNLQIVREGMRQVLVDGTTSGGFNNLPVLVAGKSGTAETNTPGGRPPHAWFTAYAPYGTTNPEILATVLIEEGSGGSLYAAPAINKTFQTYFASN